MKLPAGSPKPPKTPLVAGFSPAAPLQRLLFKINPAESLFIHRFLRRFGRGDRLPGVNPAAAHIPALGHRDVAVAEVVGPNPGRQAIVID